MRAVDITHSKANFLNKEQVAQSKYHYFVCIEEHEKLYRAKEMWKREYLKLKNANEVKE